MSNIIKADFRGTAVSFTIEGWFNATAAAKRYGKQSHEWLRLPETGAYLDALERRYGKIPYVETSRARSDRGGGTWLHPKLAVRFAQWLDIDFAVWCDEQIDELLRTGQRKAITVYQELQALQLEDSDSFAKASFGSHLMLDRKRKLPNLRERREALELQLAPPLFHVEEAA